MANPNTPITKLLLVLLVLAGGLYLVVWFFSVRDHTPRPPDVNPGAELEQPAKPAPSPAQ